MKFWNLLGLLIILAALGAGCGQTGNAPSGSSNSAPVDQSGWQKDWDNTLAAARTEGKLVAISTLGVQASDTMGKAFKDKYGIDMEFIAGASSEVYARVQKERNAGIYTPDLYLTGAASIILLKNAGYMDSIRPLIMLPEVKDPKVWLDNEINFVDPGGVMLVYQTRAIAPFLANSDLVKPGTIKSYKDLLDPKWKGQIVVYDPTIGSVGAAAFQVIWEVMGQDYVKALGKQDLVVTRDGRQQVEWIARGKYPISDTVFSTIQAQFVKEGAPLYVVLPQEGTLTSASQGTIGLLKNAPHPNAAKIFTNWLLTKDAQIVMSQLTGDPSRRLDVTNDWVDPAVRVLPGSKFKSSDTEAMLKARQELQNVAKDLWNIK